MPPFQIRGHHFTSSGRERMELYNTIIDKIDGMLGSSKPRRYAFDPDRTWEDVGGNQLVMLKESAYELGGDNKPAVNYACVTSGDYVDKDEILVYGRDLSEIRGSVPFARIAIIKVSDLAGENEEDTEPLFRAIQDIDFVKYHVYPKGYMIRSSSDSFREQVRVSKEAVRKGILRSGMFPVRSCSSGPLPDKSRSAAELKSLIPFQHRMPEPFTESLLRRL